MHAPLQVMPIIPHSAVTVYIIVSWNQTTPFPSTECIASPAWGPGEGAGDAIHPVLGKGVVWFTRLDSILY